MKKIALLLFFLSLRAASIAQCAMCKAVPTSNLEGGGNIANGLNTGILYLLAVPYVMLLIFGVYFFRKKQKA